MASTEVMNLLARWVVGAWVSSAHYFQSKGRTEVAEKWPKGSYEETLVPGEFCIAVRYQ